MISVPQALATAWRHFQAGQWQQAEQLYQQIVQVDPNQVDAWHLLGLIAGQTGRGNLAVDYLNAALRLKPDFAEAHSNLGNAFVLYRKLPEAVASFRQAVRFKPDFAVAHNNLGNALRELGHLAEAVGTLQEALRLRPDYAAAHNNLAIALQAQGKLDEAVASYQQALRLRPDYAEAHNNLNAALGEQQRLAEATPRSEPALCLDPVLAADLLGRGTAFLMQGRQEEAMARFQQAVRLDPNSAPAHLGLGVALMEFGQPAEAAASFQKALRLGPNDAGAHSNLGVALMEQGRLEEAAARFQQAIRIAPQSVDAHTHLAMTWLLMGDFKRGWPEYEWRWRTRQASMPPLPQPAWDGSPLAGRTILLRAEQGLEDTFHFLRYAPLVKQQGGTVLVECPKSLIPLVSSCPGIDGLVPRGSEQPPAADIQAGLLSLPGHLGTTLDTIPANVPYLFAGAGRIERWGRGLHGAGGLKIGIAWQGDPRHDRRGLSRRAVPLAQFLPLGRLPSVHLYSLQKGPGVEQLGQVAHLFPITDLGSQLDEGGGAFLDTAAVMKNLDLVVCSDTAIGHLAGALGVPVWLALPFVAEWRWLREREDSPWYPGMRLFRQTEPGQWQDVFERMAREVGEMLAAGGGTAR
jgi:tetratricopeptide (TPR) repeat protein